MKKAPKVNNYIVWQQIRILFLGSVLLFLANIYFGFDNALTVGDIPRWQILVHVHAGTLGWVTLSVISLAIWILTGEREVSDAYVRGVKTLTWVGLGAFAGYVLIFGLAFSRGQPFFLLMPVFGIASSLVIWTTAIFAVSQLRQQPVVTTVHLLITAALLVAALGSTMGVLLGLEYVVGFFIPGSDRIGVHAGVMDAYLLLSAAAIVEWFLRKDPQQRWAWGGLALALAWGATPVLFIPGLLFEILPLVMLSTPLIFLGLIIFLVRIGWRAFWINPLGQGAERWLFFGTIWTTFWGLFFIWVIVNFVEDISAAPHWVFVVFPHSAFVGMMTNLLLGVFSARSQDARHILSWAEPLAMWLINLGLLVFFALEILADMQLGALVMGIGVLLGVVTMGLRLLSGLTEKEAQRVEVGAGGLD